MPLLSWLLAICQESLLHTSSLSGRDSLTLSEWIQNLFQGHKIHKLPSLVGLLVAYEEAVGLAHALFSLHPCFSKKNYICFIVYHMFHHFTTFISDWLDIPRDAFDVAFQWWAIVAFREFKCDFFFFSTSFCMHGHFGSNVGWFVSSFPALLQLIHFFSVALQVFVAWLRLHLAQHVVGTSQN